MILVNNWYFFDLILAVCALIIPKNTLCKYDFFYFNFFVFIIIIGILLRPLTFSDDENYLSMLQDFNFTKSDELGKISSLFYYLNRFFLMFINNLNSLLRINFIIIWLIIWFAFHVENVRNKSLFLTFLFLLFQVLFFVQLRNAFAIVFICWALLRYFNNKSYFYLFVISALFHYSVLPFILCHFFVNWYFKKPKRISALLLSIYILCAIILSIYFYELYFSYMVVLPLFEKYLVDYISTPEIGNTSYFQLSLLVFHMFLAIGISRDIKNNNLEIYKSSITIIFGLLLAILFSTLPLFQRLILPFYLFSIISFFIQFRGKLKPGLLNNVYIFIIFIYLSIAFNRFYYFENWFIF